jgi:hypothetical protein
MNLSRGNLVAGALAGGTAAGIVPAKAVAQQTSGGVAPAAGASPDSAAESSPVQAVAQIAPPADGVVMPAGYARAMAQFAYAWGWPLVNMANRRAAIGQTRHHEATTPDPGHHHCHVRRPRGGKIPRWIQSD